MIPGHCKVLLLRKPLQPPQLSLFFMVCHAGVTQDHKSFPPSSLSPLTSRHIPSHRCCPSGSTKLEHLGVATTCLLIDRSRPCYTSTRAVLVKIFRLTLEQGNFSSESYCVKARSRVGVRLIEKRGGARAAILRAMPLCCDQSWICLHDLVLGTGLSWLPNYDT